MKIGLIGTGCSGKSTLALKLSEHYGWSLITEIARNYPRKTLHLEETQYSIFFDQLRAELFAEKNIITDRTIVDNYIYISLNHRPRKYLLNLIRAWAHTYDIIFFCKKLPFVDDGFRKDYDIEDKLLSFLKCNLIDYHILEGNEEERFNKAIKIIERYK